MKSVVCQNTELRFVLGYTPLEYRDTLHMPADGKVSCSHLITGTVGLEGSPVHSMHWMMLSATPRS